MKDHDQKPGASLSDLDGSISVHGEDGAILSCAADSVLEYHELPARVRAIARVRLLWESRKLLGTVVGVGFLFSVVWALLIPNRYQSVARLMPPDTPSSSSLATAAAALSGGAMGVGGLGGLASEMLGLKSTSDLLVGILASRTVADSIIKEFDLQKVYGNRRLSDTRRGLAAHTDASIDRKSQIITIKVTDKNSRRAAALAQAYIEELNRVVAEVSISSARRERIFLEGRLKAVNKDLEAAEKDFSEFASKNTAIDIKEQGRAMVDAAATLQGRLIATRSELAGLRQIYTDSNVRVRAMQARVDELEDQLKAVGGKGQTNARQTANTGDSLYPSIRKLPLLGVTYGDLYRRTKIEESLYETLTQQYEMAKVEEAKEIATVKVLDSPNVPDEKSFPHRTLIVLLGTTIAFVCGAGWIFGVAAWESTDPSDPAKAFALEVFDSIQAALPWRARRGLKDGKKAKGGGSKS